MSLDHAVLNAPPRQSGTPDARLAWWTALAGVAVGLLSGVGLLAGQFVLAYAGYASAALVATAILSLLHARRLLSARRTVLILALSWAAFTLAALTRLSWSLGVDLADLGLPLTGLAAWWVPLLAAGWLLGATAAGVLVGGLMATLPRGLRLFACGMIGLVAAPVIGVAVMQAAMPVLIGAATAVFAIDRGRAASARPRERADATVARPLAWLSALLGAVGVAYAFTGSLWSPAATDGTLAMAQGMTIALAAAIPLLAAVGVRSRPGAATWGPLTIAVAALGAEAYGYTFAPEWHDPSAVAAATAGGLALGWWIAARMSAPMPARILTAVAIGAAYAIPGLFLLRGLAFAVPVLAVVVALLPKPGVIPKIRTTSGADTSDLVDAAPRAAGAMAAPLRE